jgi:hypothetical protein
MIRTHSHRGIERRMAAGRDIEMAAMRCHPVAADEDRVDSPVQTLHNADMRSDLNKMQMQEDTIVRRCANQSRVRSRMDIVHVRVTDARYMSPPHGAHDPISLQAADIVHMVV